jgi:hypothetical protein
VPLGAVVVLAGSVYVNWESESTVTVTPLAR